MLPPWLLPLQFLRIVLLEKYNWQVKRDAVGQQLYGSKKYDIQIKKIKTIKTIKTIEYAAIKAKNKMAVPPSLNHSISNESIVSSEGYTTNTTPSL